MGGGSVAWSTRSGTTGRSPDRSTSAAAALGRMRRRVLVEPEHVAARVAEPRRDLRVIGADGLNDLATVGLHRIARRGDAVHHDVDEQTWRIRRRPAESKRATH